ncbi:hypothetical protein DEO72_LG5g2779 [Vigna unguiculata]|uniref:Uncharacterized protein n=1 Tax=Vigna unguiculata TaxID=3917 RepID=A0A4D6M3R6_VIGUN|nr:hypothetical protein DEO72_LG5g2779 [Vigna unguiculata]
MHSSRIYRTLHWSESIASVLSFKAPSNNTLASPFQSPYEPTTRAKRFWFPFSISTRTIHPRLGQLIETERLLEEVKQATMRTDETDKKYALVQEELSLIKQQLAMMLEKQGGGSSTSTSRVHLHYDEDLDDHPVP